MKKKTQDTQGLNPNKAKRRPGAWEPSPVKGKYNNTPSTKSKNFQRRKI